MGVERTKLGRVVATVADSDEREDSTTEKGCTGAEALLRGYNPIIGGSW